MSIIEDRDYQLFSYFFTGHKGEYLMDDQGNAVRYNRHTYDQADVSLGLDVLNYEEVYEYH